MDTIHKFGAKRNLIGIFTPGRPGSDSALMILNSGLVHRAGPFRIMAELSRHQAESGINVFRFDFSGIGDSEMLVRDDRPYRERFIDDIGEAIEFLQANFGIKRFIVSGLCTGADLAHASTVKYPQIEGCILVDGYGYPNLRFWVKRYGPALLNPKRLFNAMIKLGKRMLPGGGTDVNAAVDFFWELPKKQDYINQMRGLHDRNVKQLYVYTGGVKDYYNYKNQFYDCFSGLSFIQDVTVEYMEEADHTFIVLEYRNRLFTKISDWITENTPVSFT